jgi:predicted transcriptional regulator of viral defense system
MSGSTYLSKNLTGEQLRLVNELSSLEIDWFRMENLQEQLESKYDNIQELVENLAQKGILKRAERGVYLNSGFNEVGVIGTLMVKTGAIAYWSALHLHGLVSRFPNTVFVQTTQRKKSKLVFGVFYKFISVAERKFIGINAYGYGNYRYAITDKDKTMADCFDLPQYSGGFDGLVQAFAMSKLNSQNLINYCEAINNIAAIKRMGYLAELFRKKGTKGFISWAKKQVNPKYNLIDPGGLENGEFIRDWRLRLNVSRENIRNLASEIY